MACSGTALLLQTIERNPKEKHKTKLSTDGCFGHLVAIETLSFFLAASVYNSVFSVRKFGHRDLYLHPEKQTSMHSVC
jgi:hypothetical protein